MVRWPNGNTETLHKVAADAIYTIVEGQGTKDTKPLPQLIEIVSSSLK